MQAPIGPLLVKVGTTKGCDWLTLQRKLACPLRKDDTHIPEAFQILIHFRRPINTRLYFVLRLSDDSLA